MPSSKILNMFHLLTDAHQAKVEKLAAEPEKGAPRTLVITLMIKGERETYYSNSEDYKELIATLARKDFNEPFTPSDLKELNMKLEGIATTFKPERIP